MLIPKKILRLYKVPIAVLIFLFFFVGFHLFKPAFAYQENGAYRPFGVGYKHKTVIPIWSVAIILAIFSYLAVLIGIMYL